MDLHNAFSRPEASSWPFPSYPVSDVSIIPLPLRLQTLPGDRVVWTVKDAGAEEVTRRAEALLKVRKS